MIYAMLHSYNDLALNDFEMEMSSVKYACMKKILYILPNNETLTHIIILIFSEHGYFSKHYTYTLQILMCYS